MVHGSHEIPTVEVPERLNVATVFVDENVRQGRGDRVAIYYEDRELSYYNVLAMVNRTGNALKNLGVEIENRVLLLLFDCPEFVASFFGAIKIGAVPIPTNTGLKPQDYEYLLNDSRSKVAIMSEALADQIEAVVKPKAFVVPKTGVVGSIELAKELQEYVKAQIAPYKYPRWVEFVPELPKTARGKIQRFKLSELEALDRI